MQLFHCNNCDLMVTSVPPTGPKSEIVEHVNKANENTLLYYLCKGCGLTSCTLECLEEHMAEDCEDEWKGDSEAIKRDRHRLAMSFAKWTNSDKVTTKWYEATASREEERKEREKREK